MHEALEWVEVCSQHASNIDTDALIALLPQLQVLAARRFAVLDTAITSP